MRIEAKAVGLLQVIAIGFAIVAIVATELSALTRILCLVSIVYLVLATLGALQLLRARSLRQVLIGHAKDDTGGIVETALAAAELERESILAANWLHGALRDLLTGGGFAVLALLLTLVLGVNGASADTPASADTQPAASVATQEPVSSAPKPPTTESPEPPQPTASPTTLGLPQDSGDGVPPDGAATAPRPEGVPTTTPSPRYPLSPTG